MSPPNRPIKTRNEKLTKIEYQEPRKNHPFSVNHDNNRHGSRKNRGVDLRENPNTGNENPTNNLRFENEVELGT
ncbi:hypothetical protein V6N12_013692 [Hibiscus sabdariffa]|uniref:Uncharacterized protein n=1 Tax=Hibiscus sabdariffa TaxID=183260 RepID=A0ABR2CVE9_9ROSI